MDADELLEYALGRLDGPRRERLERQIARDPELAARVACLIRNLGRLLDDGRADRPAGTPSPPPAPPSLPDPTRSAWTDEPDDQSPPISYGG